MFNPSKQTAQVTLTVQAGKLGLSARRAEAAALLAPADLPVLANGGEITVTVPVARERSEVVRLGP